jgi:threonine/homoserine efflux transporter RhtA
VGVYFGGVTATQALFRTLTVQGKLPQLVVVASTLVIAALFNPLRRRIQAARIRVSLRDSTMDINNV